MYYICTLSMYNFIFTKRKPEFLNLEFQTFYFTEYKYVFKKTFKMRHHLVENGLGQVVEGLVDVDVGLGAGLQEADAVLARNLLAPLAAHHAPVEHVALVAQQHALHVFAGVLLKFCINILEKTLIFNGESRKLVQSCIDSI